MLKEICGLTGYQDGERFSIAGDPEKVAMQQQMQKLMQMLQLLKQKVGDKHEANMVNLQTSREKNLTDLISQDKEHAHEKIMALADYIGAMEQNAMAPPIDPNKIMALQAQANKSQQQEKQKRADEHNDNMRPMMEAVQGISQQQSEFAAELQKLKSKRRKRSGRAVLPSGKEMTFEMEEG